MSLKYFFYIIFEVCPTLMISIILGEFVITVSRCLEGERLLTEVVSMILNYLEVMLD